MRNINGVYIQRYNRMQLTDGPLFRGRYKSILIDHGTYLLQLSRYIHRNPIDTKEPLVEQLEDYPWSSYPAYIGKVEPIDWLERETTYRMLGHKQQYKSYSDFVMQGVDEETETFHRKATWQPFLVSKRLNSGFTKNYCPNWQLRVKVGLYSLI